MTKYIKIIGAFFLLFCVAAVGLGCAGQGAPSPEETETAIRILQETVGATEEQAKELVETLEANHIICTAAEESDNPIIEGMDDIFEAYDIRDKTDEEYLFILLSDDKSFSAILDKEDKLVEGMIDNGSLPKWYELYGMRANAHRSK